MAFRPVRREGRTVCNPTYVAAGAYPTGADELVSTPDAPRYPSEARAISAMPASIVREWCIEQNFGPHIAQNSALLKYSAGRVSS